MIRLFSTRSGNRYGYDSLTGRIITIHPTQAGADKTVSDQELIRQMVAEGLVDEGQPPQIRWSSSLDESIRQLEHEIPSMVLELTNVCNMRCQYCAVSGGACKDQFLPHHMPEETLMKSLDFFIEHNRDAKEAHIGFFGGEALLRFDWIQKSVDYLQQQVTDKPLSFDISTNGLLLDEAVGSWLNDHPTAEITCTVNGPYHDQYRKTPAGKATLDLIMTNLLRIRERYPSVWNNQVRFIANVDTDSEIPSLLAFYEAQLGKLPGMINNIVWEAGTRPEGLKKNEPIPVDFASESPMRTYFAHTLSPVKRRNQGKATDDAIIGSCFPCNVKLFVHTDGRFSFCERASYHHAIGDLTNGFHLQLIRRLYVDGEKLFSKKCRACWAQKQCDICLAMLIDDDGCLFSDIPEAFCAKSKAKIERNLQLFCQLAEEAPELLKSI